MTTRWRTSWSCPGTRRCCGPRRWPRWCGPTGPRTPAPPCSRPWSRTRRATAGSCTARTATWPGWSRRPTPPRRRRRIDEVNTSIYCFRRSILAPTLRRLSPANAQGEYYLTDAVGVLNSAGYTVRSLVLPDSMEAAGVNDRAQLAVAEAELRDRINERWMRRGVTMWDPERTYVDAEVHLAADVSLLPGVILRGDCVVGAGAEIGPEQRADRHHGRARARWWRAACAPGPPSATGARVGPYSVLEPGAEVAAGAEVAPAHGGRRAPRAERRAVDVGRATAPSGPTTRRTAAQ